VEKALLVDLDACVSNGTAPPANEVPTISGGTLVPALPQSGMGFPNIPNYSWGTNSNITGVFTYSPTGPTANPSTANPALPPTTYVFLRRHPSHWRSVGFRAQIRRRHRLDLGARPARHALSDLRVEDGQRRQ
jgi:hypothetical protein